MKTKCNETYCEDNTMIKLASGIRAMSSNPLIPNHLACGDIDGFVRFYDMRKLSVGKNLDNSQSDMFCCFAPERESNKECATSIEYDRTGSCVLASYQTGSIYLLDWRELSESTEKESNFDNSDTRSKFDSKQIRIHSGWDDTGPASLSTDTRPSPSTSMQSMLMQRMNEWFQDLYRSRQQETELTSDVDESDETVDNDQSTNTALNNPEQEQTLRDTNQTQPEAANRDR
jgi:hypothetical protein